MNEGSDDIHSVPSVIPLLIVPVVSYTHEYVILPSPDDLSSVPSLYTMTVFTIIGSAPVSIYIPP